MLVKVIGRATGGERYVESTEVEVSVGNIFSVADVNKAIAVESGARELLSESILRAEFDGVGIFTGGGRRRRKRGRLAGWEVGGVAG